LSLDLSDSAVGSSDRPSLWALTDLIARQLDVVLKEGSFGGVSVLKGPVLGGEGAAETVELARVTVRCNTARRVKQRVKLVI
jgi:hypothetical protein